MKKPLREKPMALGHPAAARGDVIVCRGCGCDDLHPCIETVSLPRASGLEGGASARRVSQPCSWFLIDIAAPDGICSACAAEVGYARFFMCEAMEDAA